MSTAQSLKVNQFNGAAVACIIIAAALLLASYVLGKSELFLLFNLNLGVAGDFFFKYFTHAGDGLLWIIWLVVFICKRKSLLPLLIFSFVISTLLTQVCKQLLMPAEGRPRSVIADQQQVHYVPGVTVHYRGSFPSGHTATAFCFLLLVVLLVKHRGIVLGSFAAALLAGYSRIYLGQHFPRDVGVGILIAVCAVWLSLLIQRWFDDRRKERFLQKAIVVKNKEIQRS